MKAIIEEGEPPIGASRRFRPAGKAKESARTLPIRTILVPLDFSRASIQALKFAIPFGREFGAVIHLVHVQPTNELTAISNAGGLTLDCTDAIALMQDRLSEALRRQGRFCPDNCHVVSGRPFEGICKLAHEIKADLIVLPTRGLSRLKQGVLGSTAERVVRHAPCPVLIPRGAEFQSITWNGAAATTDLELRKILVPVDFTQCSLAGVRYAARLAKDTGATLRLFHVVFPYPQLFTVDRVGGGLTPLIKTAKARAREDMSELLEMSFLREIPCETEIRTGPVIDEICGESSGPGIDLVVTSTHGLTGFKRAVIGSVAEHVVRHAKCPVLIVPNREALSMKEHTVLLVDADGDCESIVTAAAAHIGHDVLVARTSHDAFWILEDQMKSLDLVVVDFDPDAHGLAFLEAISACADRPQIVVLTALEETYMKPISLKHGAAACLGKPITVQRLSRTLEDASKRSLNCDRWGCLIPSTANKELNLTACFRGIAAKLSPTVSCHGRSLCDGSPNLQGGCNRLT